MPESLFSSYLASGMCKSAFFPCDFADRAARVREAAARPVATELVAALRLKNAPSAVANLNALANGAAAVVTGQQVGLFLGPLYSLYKAATAVVAARVLGEEAGVRCVPIFWLQTEDHDFAEIAGCTILPPAVLQLPLDDARISVAHRRLAPEVSALTGALGELIADQPHAAEVQRLFAQAYRPGASLAKAFQQVMARFFPELIFVDPRGLWPLTAPFFRRTIANAAEIERVLVERGEALRQAGFDEQVPLRPGCTLVFHHPEGLEGPRYRLEQGQDPGENSLSSSALLRPLLQDWLLPTCAYVGGPGEVAYLAQVTALYPLFDLSPPLILPRARFRLIPPAARRLLEQLGVQPADAESPDLLARLAPPAPGAPDATWLAELESRLDTLTELQHDVTRARKSIRHAMARLERRHRRAALEQGTTLAERVRRLQDWLFPNGEPQERVYGVPWFAAHTGIDGLRDRLEVDLFNSSVKDILL